ncbi:hypothetical protein [Chitinophaga pinensis]|uniref:Uncharacterized protein n=1 Tax=Chitinophaga pinensis (strain ATCC 43595 / DSM 2588 / LMG 13176 / NBRC 15968 / NCIMB 11800 / UQM 2034) TaxID=485918 RepID=A0A979G8B5_CHIPD|nr:hypothetical protein [Chitinophaga pinensis]ACU62507.1 hypothetical protein Cpin_5075 [Chitinophaga pinensis DSM 2588]
MKYLYLFILVVLLCNCRTAQSSRSSATSSDTLVRITAWGYPDGDFAEARYELSRKWGFYYDPVGNCTLDQAAIDSLTRLNEIATRPLIKKYGKNWAVKFNREMCIMGASPQTMYILSILSLMETWDVTKAFGARGDTVFYHFTPTRQKGIYHADAMRWTQNNGVKEWGSLMRYRIDNSTFNVKLISKRFIREDTVRSPLYYADASLMLQQR